LDNKKRNNPSALKKYFAVSLIILLTAILNSCFLFTKEKNKILPITAIKQKYNEWCGPCCVQMWADFRGIKDTPLPDQDEIAEVTGWPSNADLIALAVSQFTRDQGYPVYYTSGNRDRAISAQVASIQDGVPSIPMVKFGRHSVIMKGYRWTEYEDLRPRADGIWFNDPADGSGNYVSVGDWKYSFFTSWDGIYWPVVFGSAFYEYQSQGDDGLREFHLRHGTIYGEDPEGGEDPPPLMI